MQLLPDAEPSPSLPCSWRSTMLEGVQASHVSTACFHGLAHIIYPNVHACRLVKRLFAWLSEAATQRWPKSSWLTGHLWTRPRPCPCPSRSADAKPGQQGREAERHEHAALSPCPRTAASPHCCRHTMCEACNLLPPSRRSSYSRQTLSQAHQVMPFVKAWAAAAAGWQFGGSFCYLAQPVCVEHGRVGACAQMVRPLSLSMRHA